MIFKPINNLVPNYLYSSMFTERIESGYAIRDSTNRLAALLPRANYLKKSFSYRGATNPVILDEKDHLTDLDTKLDRRHSWKTGLVCSII